MTMMAPHEIPIPENTLPCRCGAMPQWRHKQTSGISEYPLELYCPACLERLREERLLQQRDFEVGDWNEKQKLAMRLGKQNEK